jgi:hypothetical protein
MSVWPRLESQLQSNGVRETQMVATENATRILISFGEPDCRHKKEHCTHARLSPPRGISTPGRVRHQCCALPVQMARSPPARSESRAQADASPAATPRINTHARQPVDLRHQVVAKSTASRPDAASHCTGQSAAYILAGGTVHEVNWYKQSGSWFAGNSVIEGVPR